MARKEKWYDHLVLILLTKPAEVVQEACQVLKKHGCRVKKELKSELYSSSTNCQVVFQILRYANVTVAHAPTTLVWLARPSQYAPGGVVGKGRSSGDSD